VGEPHAGAGRTGGFTRNAGGTSTTDFPMGRSIGGIPVEPVDTRVSVTNHGAAAVTVPSGQSGPGLVTLGSASDTVKPGRTVHHDFVAAVDTFSTTVALPSAAALTPAKKNAGALSYDAAYRHMAQYWNQPPPVPPK